MPPDRQCSAFEELALPTRSSIRARLAHCDTSESELPKSLAMGLPTTSKHLKGLDRGGGATGPQARYGPGLLRMVDSNDYGVPRCVHGVVPAVRVWEEHLFL